MTARIPVTYAGAPKLSADARAALACARLVWESLPVSERIILSFHVNDGETIWTGRRRDRDRLIERGISARTPTEGKERLTILGLLVREVGMRTTVEVDDAD